MDLNQINELHKLAGVLGCKITDEVSKEYYNTLKKIPVDKFAKICQYLAQNWTKTGHYPLIGHFLEAQRYVRTENTIVHDQEIPYNERVTGGEMQCYRKCVSEINKWHRLKMVEFNKSYCLASWKNPDGNYERMDLEEWQRRGFPPTWSPILDDMQKKSLEPYRKSISREEPKALEIFYQEYYNKLVSTRKKRREVTK